MSIITYRKSPGISTLPESFPVRPKKVPYTFIVHRYKHPQLHYVFSIEVDGVKKNWSVSKGPSMSTRDKRLAVMIQDHWMSEADANDQRELWDVGTYQPDEGKLSDQLEKEHLKFKVSGRKLNGAFSLVKIKGTEDCWLLMKQEDKYAISGVYNSEYYTG